MSNCSVIFNHQVQKLDLTSWSMSLQKTNFSISWQTLKEILTYWKHSYQIILKLECKLDISCVHTRRQRQIVSVSYSYRYSQRHAYDKHKHRQTNESGGNSNGVGRIWTGGKTCKWNFLLAFHLRQFFKQNLLTLLDLNPFRVYLSFPSFKRSQFLCYLLSLLRINRRKAILLLFLRLSRFYRIT